MFSKEFPKRQLYSGQYYSDFHFHLSYIAPEIREKFESLSVNLKNTILERNVRIQNIHDLIKVLEDIVAEDE